MHPSNTTIKLVNGTTKKSLSCKADGATSYRWERQNGRIPFNVNGENNNTLTFINLQPEDDGNYQCVASNASGSSYSFYAKLRVLG